MRKSAIALAVAGAAALTLTSYADTMYSADDMSSQSVVSSLYTEEPDGAASASTLTWYFPDGSVAYDERPAGVTWVYADGTLVFDGGMGAVAFYYPDGSVAEQQPLAMTTWYFPDGIVISSNTPSTVSWYMPDGTVIEALNNV